ncbi:MAG: T9SS type A sorting domain-containing protein [Bacteroidetes bacterium]|nr:T9SS type A sorting domain-containing protein [Bacteroidota bacterium]
MNKEARQFCIRIIYLLIISGLVAQFSYSQGYHKLIRTNTYWDCYENFFEKAPGGCYQWVKRYYFTNQEIVFAGHTYTISRYYPFLGSPNINNLLCSPFVVDTISSLTTTYLREDTVARIVWIYLGNQQEAIIYDFSLHVGDTLMSPFQYDNTPYIVNHIDTVLLANGEPRLRFFFDPDLPVYYTESIGSERGLFQPIKYVPDYQGYFCVTENHVNIYGSYCSNFFIGIDNRPPDDNCSIAQDPSQSTIVIHFPQPDKTATFKLWNISGQLIVAEDISTPETNIKLSQITSGIYIAQLIWQKGFLSKKIIINN